MNGNAIVLIVLWPCDSAYWIVPIGSDRPHETSGRQSFENVRNAPLVPPSLKGFLVLFICGGYNSKPIESISLFTD